MRSRQLALDLNGDGSEGPIPVVYLACRLTGLTNDQRKLLDSWCAHIEEVVTETAAESENKWDVAVHIPFTWSAPWNDDRPPEDIYAINSTTVSGCAAVIILCIDGVLAATFFAHESAVVGAAGSASLFAAAIRG